MEAKFALYNFSGQPVRFFQVESEDVKPSGAGRPAPSHHIAILDVSGSMWGDIEAVKSIVEKVFTAEEFNDPSQKVSLITYSSHGDCRVHFERVTVADVLAPNSPHLREIRSLRVRGLTGISQALQKAETLIDDVETTCISLHTDGYANDPSPFAEARHLVAAVEAIEKHPNVFCNTVAYRHYCDFALLDAIANRLSGVCIRASSAKQVYEALHASQSLLAGAMAPVIEVGLGTFDLAVFVSKSARKVLGGPKGFTVRGLSAGDDATVYRYREVSEAAYKATSVSEIDIADIRGDAILAYCRVQIALGNINLAKYAMVTTRITNFITRHARALVASEVAAMAVDAERFLFEPLTCIFKGTFGLEDTGPSVLSLLAVLNTYRGSLRVNVTDLMKGYKRRGIKRVAGTRDENGTLMQPTCLLIPKNVNGNFVDVASIDVNRDSATVQLKTVQDAVLMANEPGDGTGTPITEIAGIPLDLKDYRNYTIVGDGVVTTPVLPIRTNDKRCFAALKQMGLVSGDFDPNTQYDLPIGKMPVVEYDQTFKALDAGVIYNLARLTTLQKLLSGLLKDESEALTPEQVAALKEHHLTPALYYSPPTTNPYIDLTDAINQGEVDTRLSYKVRIGTPDVIHLGKLRSGNAYLQRRFTLHQDADGKQVEVKKPTLDLWWADNNRWGIKSLSARTKLDGVDDVMYPIFAEFLRLERTGALAEVFGYLNYDAGDIYEFEAALDGGCTRDEAVQVFKRVLGHVANAIDVLYEQVICPLVFFVGATGLVPDGFDAPAMTAEQLTEKYPKCSLGKAEMEGMYYEIAVGLLLGVFTQAEHFSTDKGVETAREIE